MCLLVLACSLAVPQAILGVPALRHGPALLCPPVVPAAAYRPRRHLSPGQAEAWLCCTRCMACQHQTASRPGRAQQYSSVHWAETMPGGAASWQRCRAGAQPAVHQASSLHPCAAVHQAWRTLLQHGAVLPCAGVPAAGQESEWQSVPAGEGSHGEWGGRETCPLGGCAGPAVDMLFGARLGCLGLSLCRWGGPKIASLGILSRALPHHTGLPQTHARFQAQ